MFVSGEDASNIVVLELRIKRKPWGDPTAAESAILKRQASFEQAVRCMEPKAKAADLEIEYPFSAAY